MPRSDEEIRKDVEAALAWDTRVNEADIDVEVKNGSVTLRGSVPTYLSDSSARADAWSIRGVINVKDELTIDRPDVVAAPTDAEIEKSVRNMLSVSPDIDDSKITNHVKDGVVTLEGSVDTHWKKGQAEDIAFHVMGVVKVNNLLTVVPTREYSDETIANQIIQAIDRDSRIDARNVNVEVKGGIVTLAGTVQSGAARKAACEAASHTSGVVEIVDDLQVSEAI